MEDKEKILTALKAAKVQLFSHPERTPNTFKRLMKNVPLLPEAEIREALKNLGKPPVKIDRSKKGDDPEKPKTYLIEWESGTISPNDLSNMLIICKHRVRWDTVSKKAHGPYVCRRCVLFKRLWAQLTLK